VLGSFATATSGAPVDSGAGMGPSSAVHALVRFATRDTGAPRAPWGLPARREYYSHVLRGEVRVTAGGRKARKAHTLADVEGSARVLDGRQIAGDWQDEIASEVAHIKKFGGRAPGLAVVLVGQRPDSVLYVDRKSEAAAAVGFDFKLEQLPYSVTQAELVATVRQLCADASVDGVLVQLPLPKHVDEEAVMEAFDPRKDVDGFHPVNIGRLVMRGRHALHVPCTPRGCLEMLRRSGISVKGRHAVILGDSNIVGTPLSMLLRDHGAASVTVCHRLARPAAKQTLRLEALNRARAGTCLPAVLGPKMRPAQGDAEGGDAGGALDDADAEQLRRLGFPDTLPGIIGQADVLVAAVGEPELVRAEWVKPGAVVIDVGINVVPANGEGARPQGDPDLSSADWRIVGDVAFEEVSKVAGYVSPVPGGVGPMTIAALLSNTLESAKLAMGLTDDA